MLYGNLSINDKGRLCISGRDAVCLAEKYSTPLYVMDEEIIKGKCLRYINSLKKNFKRSLPLYASKACSFKAIYRIMKSLGMGVDVASSGELFTALQAGFPSDKICFHGNNKTDFDLEYAVNSKVAYIVCDSMDELNALGRIAKENGVTQKILLRLTPGIDPHTHAKISTGNVDSKFGFLISNGDAEKAVVVADRLSNINLCGFHCHVGSQIFSPDPFADAAAILAEFVGLVKKKYGINTDILNLGGGFGVPYTEDTEDFNIEENIDILALTVKDSFIRHNLDIPMIMLEPGRSIVADSGVTLYRCGTVKKNDGIRNYISVDGGMTDNPRYTLYEAKYTVINASRANDEYDGEYAIAGRCCESGDLLAVDVAMPKTERGDVIAVLTTGAYNYSMASNYNRIPRPPVIMLTKDGEYIAVKRESFEDLTRNDL